jgi:hypothetical protein
MAAKLACTNSLCREYGKPVRATGPAGVALCKRCRKVLWFARGGK